MHATLRAIPGTLSLALFAPLAAAQCPEQRLVAADTAIYDQFGRSLALDGERALVGTSGELNLPFAEAAYVFELRSGAWVEIQRLQPDDPTGARFGFSTALEGDVAVVGAPSYELGAGAAYVFARDGTTWTQVALLRASAPQIGDEFGCAVALAGDWVFVGARARDGLGTSAGAVYAFERAGDDWAERQELVASDGEAYDEFGFALAAQEGRLVVGAPKSFGVTDESGAAYVFEHDGPDWSEQALLVSPAPHGNDRFGHALALDGARVLIGAPGSVPSAPGPGRVHAFVRSGSEWVHEATLARAGEPAEDFFGWSVTLDGQRALVGQYVTNGAHVFDLAGGRWLALGALDVGELGPTVGFGSAVALERDVALVGASSDAGVGFASGAVFTYDAREVPERSCPAAPHSGGEAARLELAGTTCLAAADLVLSAGPLPERTGLFLASPTSGELPLAAGTLCVGRPFVRLRTAPAAGGVLRRALDVGAPGAPPIAAGSTWTFQAWFRDGASSGGSAVSDALAVTFCP